MIKLNLNQNWQFKQLEKQEWLPANVPGCVHTDLLENKKVDNPFYGTNENAQQWVEYRDWEYKSTFNINEDLFNQENINLVFEGLDTYAKVFLNDAELIETENMYRTWTVSAKENLKLGKNTLHIIFKSAINTALPILTEKNFRYHALMDNAVEASAVTRKAPYHYGWDWGPRFVTAGIWKPVFIEAWSEAKIDNIFIQQGAYTPEIAKLSLQTAFETSNLKNGRIRIINIQTEDILKEASIQIEKGLTTQTVDFTITNPQRWFPNGYGDPFLYQLKVELLIDNKVVDTKTTSVGLRTVKLNKQKDQWGESFEFIVNDIPVFIKGANWIPADNFISRIPDSQYKNLIKSSKDAHFNMLRVWGGGIYETETFYKYCDEMGILVWQDFMFACSLFPGDDTFLENVKQEAIQNVKRLRNHPSLVLWCGNNENEWIYDFAGGGMQRRFGIPKEEVASFKEAYDKLYHQLLSDVINEYNPNLTYWPSSPSSEGKAPANDENYGDIHHWDVWHMGYPISDYKKLTPRFISEFGFQGMPAPSTIDTYLEEEQRFLGSPAMATHQKHARGYELIKHYMERSYAHPKDFDGFAYLSQVQQADYMKIAVEHFRSLKPKCMGILYWQLNDCWPVCSWASIDYNLQWKAFHYYAKKFYAPTLVYPELVDDNVRVMIISDNVNPQEAILSWQLIHFNGNVLENGNEQYIEIDALSCLALETISAKAFIENYDTSKMYFRFELKVDDEVVSSNRLFFEEPKRLQLENALINAEVEVASEAIFVHLSTNTLAKNVFLDFEGDNGFFEDNYFDMDGNQELTIKYIPENKNFKGDLKVVSMKDMIES
ncbi:glycoside hydrolase family 2 protein [uncultured Algibacter sp.]|uniref:beta-mannosidase n=1 Tax=uncultured Algibacter sp. TaxID=298659 RepID=UPI00260EB7FB|nr:glycoside hydrolase family 2 protein [uncultured Algibacter sp.]